MTPHDFTIGSEPRCRTLLLAQPLWDLDLHVAAWRGSVDGFHDRGESPLYATPARREQHDDRKPASGEVLLMSEVGIGGDEDLVPLSLRSV